MSKEDALKAIDCGVDAVMISNHGGRQLDGSRSPFDQIKEIKDSVEDKLELICDGGIKKRYAYSQGNIRRSRLLFWRTLISLRPCCGRNDWSYKGNRES